METDNKRIKISEWGLALVCLIAVFLSASSILSTYRIHQTTSMIYDHPYTVSNEARAMHARLLDMRFFIMQMLNQPDRDSAVLQTTLNERYEMQYESAELIAQRYLGPQEDCAKLLETMQDLEKTQDEALPLVLPMDVEPTLWYVEEKLYPKYDAVSDALLTIISFADRKVQGLEKQTADMAANAILAAVLLTVFLPGYFVTMFLRERKNMRELIYRERLFDILSTNVDEVFLILNKITDALEYVSANSERVLGFKRDDFTKEIDIVRERIDEEERPAFDALFDIENQGSGKSADFLMLFPSGERRWIRIQTFAERAQDKVVRQIVSISDQTEEMKLRQTLKDALVNAQNANAAKQNFLSRMSHEIRTPMNAIIGMTTIAAAYIEDRSRVESCLEKIGYSSKHLMSLINDVLDMSKIDEGKMTINHELFHLENVTESITSIIYPQAAQKRIHFSMPLVDLTNTALLGDSLRLNQILLNLLSNALKFTPEGGTIRLEIRQLYKKNGRIRLRFTVSDTGIGMGEEFIDRLFLPFEQEKASTGQRFGGTGLGMSITKNLVTLMGGTISVKSRLEQGSTFTVELDFDIPDGEEQTAYHGHSLESLNVLVADDDRDSCVHTSLLLENLGITSCWVLSGRECVEKVCSAHKVGGDYDVCLIDWKMPDMDGIEVTRRVRELVGPDTTIIIITAYDWTSIEQSAREAGANAFLSKPIFASTLYNTLLSATGLEKTVRTVSRNAGMTSMAGRHVMLVEDNALNREIAMEMLNLMKIDVVCVNNGQEAVEKFAEIGGSLDLILMDVQMPVMDGYQATEAIRKSGNPKSETIPIIAMTADAFHEDVVKAAAAGMNGHLAKPVDMDLLYQMIREKIEGNERGGAVRGKEP